MNICTNGIPQERSAGSVKEPGDISHLGWRLRLTLADPTTKPIPENLAIRGNLLFQSALHQWLNLQNFLKIQERRQLCSRLWRPILDGKIKPFRPLFSSFAALTAINWTATLLLSEIQQAILINRAVGFAVQFISK